MDDTLQRKAAAGPVHTLSRRSASRTRSRLFGAVVVFVCTVVLAGYFAARPQWTSDSYEYGIVMLTDLGQSRAEATAHAQAFFMRLPQAQDKFYAAVYSRPVFEPYWKLFAPRVLYPALAAVLWPRFGFFALIYVSLAAYVLGTLLVYMLLLEFAVPWISTIGALLFAVSVPVTWLGRTALTDMLALAFWVAVLLCLIRYLRTYQLVWFVGFCVSSLALNFTRPVTYATLLATLVPFGAGIIRKDRRYTTASFACLIVAVIDAVLLWIVASLDHVPGMAFVIKDMQRAAHDPPMPAQVWYVHAIVRDVYSWVLEWVRDIAPVVAIAAMIAYRKHFAVPVLAGALLAGFVTIAADPLYFDFSRTLIAPMLPVILSGVALAVSSAPRHRLRDE